MITYFDTSALVPLLVIEPTTAQAARLWSSSTRIVTARIAYAEAAAALARAARMDRIGEAELELALRGLDELYEQIDRINIDERVVRRAAQLACQHGLRGHDAVHLASAEQLNDSDTVMVAGDGQLCDTAHALGMAVTRLHAVEE